ncbi:MAG: hypothetical protein U0L99_00010 [Ruminococcus sp.]|nr:hypothetical protein [Ruminococcus sp.]
MRGGICKKDEVEFVTWGNLVEITDEVVGFVKGKRKNESGIRRILGSEKLYLASLTIIAVS